MCIFLDREKRGRRQEIEERSARLFRDEEGFLTTPDSGTRVMVVSGNGKDDQFVHFPNLRHLVAIERGNGFSKEE